MLEGRRSLREYRLSSDSSPLESFCMLRVTRGRPVLEEVPLDNKEELRTCGPSFPVDLQEALGTLRVLALHLSVRC